MQIEGLPWPPTASTYYLATDEHRPVCQGDVFSDVPFLKGKRGNRLQDAPNTVYDRRHVAVMGYTCDIYNERGTLNKVQVVAPVVEAERIGIPGNWAGAFNFAPLPDLLGDGKMYAVDLTVMSNIDAFYLPVGNRVRSLSEIGWAAFRQRIELSATRAIHHIDDLRRAGEDVWNELSLWEAWNRSGRPPSEFQLWLDEPQTSFGGFTRRELLHRGIKQEIFADLPR